MKILTTVLVIGFALVFVWRELHPNLPNDVAQPCIGLGQVLAREAARELGGQGGHVVVIYMPTASAQSQATLESLKHALGQTRGITVGVKEFKTDEVGAMDMISFKQFAAVMNECADAKVIISFLGVNQPLTSIQIAQLPQPLSKLIVVRWNPAEAKRGLASGLVSAAVLSRVGSSLPAGHPETPIQWFDHYYQLITLESNMSTK